MNANKTVRKFYRVTYYAKGFPDRSESFVIAGTSKDDVVNAISADTRLKGMTVKIRREG